MISILTKDQSLLVDISEKDSFKIPEPNFNPCKPKPYNFLKVPIQPMTFQNLQIETNPQSKKLAKNPANLQTCKISQKPCKPE